MQLVETLQYKPEGRGFNSTVFLLEFFIDIILRAALWLLGSTQPLTTVSTKNTSWGLKVAGAYC